MNRLLENDWKVCENLGISRETFHCIHMQLHGISCGSDRSELNANCVYIDLPYTGKSTEYVPRKIPLKNNDESIYEFRDGRIIFKPNNEDVFRGKAIQFYKTIIDDEKYSEGYSFPFIGTATPYYELRINPKNTGHCPGKCAFCHRDTSHRRIPTLSRGIVPPKQIVTSIIENHGIRALDEVNHVSIITELFGSEIEFLRFAEEIKVELARHTEHKISFRACAQDVRSMNGLMKLKEIVDDDKYSFTLETFTKRREIMSEYKGIPVTSVMNILKTAKIAGFNSIKLNYVAGIDSIEDFDEFMRRFRKDDIADMLGLSIFTAITPDQEKIRHEQGWNAHYYVRMVSIISELGIALYEPNCFDMGLPEELIQRCKIVTDARLIHNN